MTDWTLFNAALPKFTREARWAFRNWKNFEAEEAIAEVVANCTKEYARMYERGIATEHSISKLAFFAIRAFCAGRKTGTPMNVDDVGSVACLVRKGVERVELGDLSEVLAETRQQGPAETAAARIDFAIWMKSLSPRMRKIAKILSTGESTKVIAERLGVSPGRVSQLRAELLGSWKRLHGLK